LQQATVLGDIYVAVERAPEVSAAASMFATEWSDSARADNVAAPARGHDRQSGGVRHQRVRSADPRQHIRINNVTPQRLEQVRAISSRVAVDLQDLSRNIDTVDSCSMAWRVRERDGPGAPKLDYWFSRPV